MNMHVKNLIEKEANAMSSLETKLDQIKDQIIENGKQADATDQFSTENYELLRQQGIFSALIPEDLGGGGYSFEEVCRMLSHLASLHPSTALSCSMHQHIVAANLYNHLHDKPGQALLEKVAKENKILISTGAGDWLASTGELKKTEGGYLFNGIKHFASGSPGGDILVTSGPYEDAEQGWQVFHFPIPMGAEGVEILDNWEPMGMRGTGSNSVKLENVFIPEAAVAVKRSRGDFHGMWCVILPVALSLIMSVYRGIAETAANRARERCQSSKDPVTPYILGEMENALTTAQIIVDDMIGLAKDYNFSANLQTTNEFVKRKTIAANACKETALKAVEVCGGPGFLRQFGIENLLRDVMASHFHPLQEKRQLLFTGSLSMGNEPPSQAF